MKKNIKILLVEDNQSDYLLLKNYLQDIRNYSFDLEWTPDYEKGLEIIKGNTHDVYLLDYLLGNYTGLELLKAALSHGSEAPFIVLTGYGNHQVDIDAMEIGASDFLTKDDLDSEKLERSIRYSLERQTSLKAIRESEAKYRSVFEASRDMIFIADEKGNFVDFNDSASRLFGYSQDEFSGASLSVLFYNEEEEKTFLEALKVTGALTNYEVILKGKDGAKKYCLISASFQPLSESKLYIFGNIHDITRRKMAERDLNIIEKIAVTGRVAQMLAHEIRNPLTTINLAVTQLEDSLPSKDDSTFLEMIKNNSRRIDDLVKEVLSLSKPEKVEMGSYNLNKLIDDALAFAMDRIRIKKIKVEKEYDTEVCEIMVDESKMKTALLNIIVNAVEAMPESEGILLIRTRKEGERCYIEIKDNGVGIAKENLGKLFEPYYTNKPHGAGIGLSSVHSIIQLHKATIEVESELNKGTTFIIGLNL